MTRTYWKVFSGREVVEIVARYLETSNVAKGSIFIGNKTLVHCTNKIFFSSSFFLNAPEECIIPHIFENLMIFPRVIYCSEYLREVEYHEVNFPSI